MLLGVSQVLSSTKPTGPRKSQPSLLPTPTASPQQVDSRQFAPFESFPKSQKVTYKFYLGRLAIFDENYVRWWVAGTENHLDY